MTWPDKRALQGFRSLAQAKWAQATDQWWAPEYHKHTNYKKIPRYVKKEEEDLLEWLEKNDISLDESLFGFGKNKNKKKPELPSDHDDLFQKLNNLSYKFLQSKDIDKVEDLADQIFVLDQKFRQEYPGVKLSKKRISDAHAIERRVNKWREEGMSPDYEQKWDEFFEYHGSVLNDEKTIDDLEMKKEKEKTRMLKGVGAIIRDLIASKVSSGELPRITMEVIDNLSSESRSALASKATTGDAIDIRDALLAGMVGEEDKGGLSSQEATQTIHDAGDKLTRIRKKIQGHYGGETLQESASLNRRIARKYGLDEELVENIWDDSVAECSATMEESKSSKLFWKKVVETFKNKINNIDILEAKRVMNAKRLLRMSVENFIDNLASGKYEDAQNEFPRVVREKLNTMINSRKETYMKNVGEDIKEKSKGA